MYQTSVVSASANQKLPGRPRIFPLTRSTNPALSPLRIFGPVTPRPRPPSKVAIPRVATMDGIPSRTESNAFAVPINAARPSTKTIAAATGQLWSTSSQVRIDAPSENDAPIDRSNSPADRLINRPSVRTSSADCEPRMFWALARVPKVSGFQIQKTAMMTAHAIRIAYRSSRSPRLARGGRGVTTDAPPGSPSPGSVRSTTGSTTVTRPARGTSAAA